MVKPLSTLSFLLLLLLTTPACFAQPEPFIRIALENEKIYLGETVILTLEHTGLTEALPMDILEKISPERRETVGSHLRVHQSQVVEIRIYRIELNPERTGTFSIGPFKSGDTVSNLLWLDVEEGQRKQWTMEKEDVELSVSLTPNRAWLQQEMLYEVQLKHRYPLLSPAIQIPQFKGFRVIPLVKEKRTWEDAGDGWRTMEWRYLLFPENSGDTPIAGVSASGEILKSRRLKDQFSRSSPPLHVTVLPQTPTSSGHSSWWLPAKSVTLSEQWSTPATELLLGSEVNRSLTIEATGVTAEQIPTPTVDNLRGMTVTLEHSTRSQVIEGNTVRSTARFDYRYLPTSATPVFLESVKIPWWNTQQKKHEAALLPARRIDIAMPSKKALVDALMARETWPQRIKASLAGISSQWLWLPITGVSLVLIWLRFTSLITYPKKVIFRSQESACRKQLIKKLKVKDAAQALRLTEEWKAKYSLTREASAIKDRIARLALYPSNGSDSVDGENQIIAELKATQLFDLPSFSSEQIKLPEL